MTEKELVAKMLDTLVKSRKELAGIDLGITKKSLPDLDKIIEHISAPLMIMVMGEFSTGKSTFINAMVGEEVTAVNATPTTAVITKLCYGVKDKILVHFTDGTEKEYKKTAFKRLTSKTGKKNEDKTHESIEYVERQLPLDMLQYVTIIDSPGLNDINEQNSDTTKKFINNADTMFFMFSALKPVSKTEIDAMESLTPRLKPIAIINKMDEFDEEEENKGQEEFLEDIRVKLKDKVQAVVGISAKYALEGKLERNETKAEIGNLKELEQVVRNLVLPNRDQFKLNTLMDELGEWIDLTATELKDLDDINQKNKEVIYEDYLSLKSKIQQNREIISNIAIEIKEYVIEETKKYNEQALYLLGIFFDQGIVFGKDDEQAEQYLESAALKNHIGAQAALGGVYLTNKDIKKAKFWLEKAAKQNDKTALFALGAIYLANEETGEFDNDQEPDYKKAAALFEKAAAMNEPNSLFALYLMYLNGKGVEENVEKAMGFLVRAAKLGHASALNALGKGLISDIENDYSTETIVEAMDCFSRAEEYGDADAIFNLAEVYRRFGKEEIRDQESLHYYKKAALLGNSDAQYWLAKYYGNGVGLAKDQEQAFVWYTKSAEQENAKAQNMLGRCYQEGWGVDKDRAKAIEWFKKSAEQGYSAAQCNLAYIYDRGEGIGQDYKEAFKWFEKAAEQGENAGLYMLGVYYQFGRFGIEKDEAKAFKCYQKAAEQGDKFAQYQLATCFVDGIGTKSDPLQAFQWFKKAAEQGDDSAQYRLGYCYEIGWGTALNKENAIYWYKKAAEQGHENAKTRIVILEKKKQNVENQIQSNESYFEKCKREAEQGDANAQYELAVCYDFGNEILQNDYQAFRWYEKAASQGNAQAQYQLGNFYAKGRVVTQSTYTALIWYKKAAAQGYKKAELEIDRLQNSKDNSVKKSSNETIREAINPQQTFGSRQATQLNSQKANLHKTKKVDKSTKETYFEECKKGAVKGDMRQQYEVALCCEMGHGCKKDENQAFYWYQKSAEQGYAQAQYALAGCYIKGVGVTPNKYQAINWYEKAAAQGYEKAKLELQRLNYADVNNSGRTANNHSNSSTYAHTNVTNSGNSSRFKSTFWGIAFGIFILIMLFAVPPVGLVLLIGCAYVAFKG